LAGLPIDVHGMMTTAYSRPGKLSAIEKLKTSNGLNPRKQARFMIGGKSCGVGEF
jgi:hypothetical protein